MATTTPPWVSGIRGVCPSGWSVGPFRNGVRLQIRKTGQPHAVVLLKMP
tara:strand:+ start:192 stop:338 length:147 start_codon:yes stop_codon:yes gene_type:complete